MRVAILGDIHLYDLKAWPWQMLGKRLVGQANLWLNRRLHFNPDLLGPVIEKVLSLQPDWVLLTGDLTTTALESELRLARQMLDPLLAKRNVVMIPGNHDRYTFSASRRRRFEAHFAPVAPQDYPHVTQLSPAWRLIALDSAVPRLFSSRGRLGQAQLDRFAKMLDETPTNQSIVVMCHYPPALPEHRPHCRSHSLADDALLRRLLENASPRIVLLHGHIHRPWHWKLSENVQIVNAGSPCMMTAQYPQGQGFWQLEIQDAASAISPMCWTHHWPAKTAWQQDMKLTDPAHLAD